MTATIAVASITKGAILAGVLVAHYFGRRATILVVLVWGVLDDPRHESLGVL